MLPPGNLLKLPGKRHMQKLFPNGNPLINVFFISISPQHANRCSVNVVGRKITIIIVGTFSNKGIKGTGNGD